MTSSAITIPRPQIRDWVLFPITVVMILVGVLRHYVVLLLQSPQKKLPRTAIREHFGAIPNPTHYFSKFSNTTDILSVYLTTLVTSICRWNILEGRAAQGDSPSTPPNPLTDPSQMDGMMAGMKTQMVMMVPQMIIMGWINFFFQGFVLIKLPFPLTLGFKSMLQRGVETPDMDVRWVSSLSWYFLNFFGLNGLYRIILGNDNSADSSRDMTTPFAAAAAPQGPQAQDFNKVFKAERDNLEFAEGLYSWVGKDVETTILKKYGRLSPEVGHR